MVQDEISRTFAALADPTRRAMLQRLAAGEAIISDIAGPFLTEMSLPAVTKHLKVLEKAGLVTKTREAQCRRCRLNPQALKQAADWIEEYRQFWEESLDRLDEYLKELKVENNKQKSEKENERKKEKIDGKE
ncbi:MAG: winged helix-turn-helix transcriptional regulator [Spirochaetales bacterium]|nr:winged helix-turn-helix transcriptional regulator [Spirochaetales bacterium]